MYFKTTCLDKFEYKSYDQTLKFLFVNNLVYDLKTADPCLDTKGNVLIFTHFRMNNRIIFNIVRSKELRDLYN